MKKILQITAGLSVFLGLICMALFFFKGAGAGKLSWEPPTVRKSLMTFAYKIYANPAAQNGRYFLSKIVFRNRGTAPVRDFSISYQIPDYLPWTTPETHTEIPSGQTIVQLFYPQLPSKVTQLTSQTTATLETKIRWADKPGEMKEIAFLEMPGLGINRLSWMGGRYAYVSAHFDGFTDHCLCIVDLNEITKPVIVSRWWLPGMNRAAGEEPNTPKGKRYALHHMIVAGKLGYGAWRDGGFTIHDVSDPTQPKLLSHINWSPPFPGGTHTPLPLPGRKLAVVADEANAEKCAKGLFQIFVIDARVPENPVTISTMPVPRDRDYCAAPGTFGPHNLHENRPGSFQSEETIFATYNAGGVRVFDLRDQFAPKELAFWLPPTPAKLIDPRPNIALAAKTADIYVTRDGLIYASDWNAGLHVLQYEG